MLEQQTVIRSAGRELGRSACISVAWRCRGAGERLLTVAWVKPRAGPPGPLVRWDSGGTCGLESGGDINPNLSRRWRRASNLEYFPLFRGACAGRRQRPAS